MLEDPHLNDPLKTATIVALTRLLGPLIDLMLDTGVTVQEFSRIVRECAVRRAYARITKESGRGSKSRVAILTGLPRSEVARILMAADMPSVSRPGQHPARKVLAGWYDNPAFLSENGEPAVLPIFGTRRSFERLVARYSGGIPVRAMLDQLIQTDAIDVLPGQHVKAKSRVPTFTGFNNMSIAAIGDRTRDLLDTLLSNLRSPIPLFEGTAVMSDVHAEALPIVRKELAEQGAVFIESANSLLGRSRNRTRHSKTKNRPKCRVGITAYYFQSEIADDELPDLLQPTARRKNLHRQTRKVRTGKRESASSAGRRPA